MPPTIPVNPVILSKKPKRALAATIGPHKPPQKRGGRESEPFRPCGVSGTAKGAVGSEFPEFAEGDGEEPVVAAGEDAVSIVENDSGLEIGSRLLRQDLKPFGVVAVDRA